MKTVAMLIGISNSPHIKELYVTPSLHMQNVFAEHHISLVRVSVSSFQSDGRFSHYFILDEQGGIKKIHEPITPDIIRARVTSYNLFVDTTISKKLPVVPQFTLRTLSADKYETYLHLQEFMPTTTLLGNFLSSAATQQQFGDQLVLKSIRNHGGRGIEFLDKNVLLQHMDRYLGSEKTVIVQEFKDFGKGYKNLIAGIHDLRVVYVGDEISFSVIRTPKTGDLRSNIAAGGSQHSIAIEDIPNEVLELAKKIKTKLEIGSQNIFSLDFGYCAGEKKWYFLEINASPGIRFPEKDKKRELKYFTDLAEFFIEKTQNVT